MRIVLLHPGSLGDIIVSTPLLRQIRLAVPQAKIAIVLGPLTQSIRPLLGDMVDETLDFSKRPAALAKLWWRARRERFDWLLDPSEGQLKASKLLVRLIGARRSVGFAKGFDGLYDVTLPILPQGSTHIVHRYLTLLQPLGLPQPTDPQIKVSLSPQAIEWARRQWPADCRPSVLVNISGTGSNKAWGADRYVAFIAAVRTSHPQLRFVLTGHHKDEGEMESIGRRANVPRLPSTLHFDQFAAFIHEADYVMTPETSVLHLAAAWKKPCLGLYVQRPNGDNWTPYRTPNVKLLSPTIKVADITIEQAVAGFDRLVSEVGSLSPAG